MDLNGETAGQSYAVAVPWLKIGDRNLAPLEIASSRRAVRRGLLGRDEIVGGLLLLRCSAVHTFGMRFGIDVAFLDAGMTVLDTVTMRPRRFGLPRPTAIHVLEAAAGEFKAWGVSRGERLAVDSGCIEQS